MGGGRSRDRRSFLRSHPEWTPRSALRVPPRTKLTIEHLRAALYERELRYELDDEDAFGKNVPVPTWTDYEYPITASDWWATIQLAGDDTALRTELVAAARDQSRYKSETSIARQALIEERARVRDTRYRILRVFEDGEHRLEPLRTFAAPRASDGKIWQHVTLSFAYLWAVAVSAIHVLYDDVGLNSHVVATIWASLLVADRSFFVTPRWVRDVDVRVGLARELYEDRRSGQVGPVLINSLGSPACGTCGRFGHDFEAETVATSANMIESEACCRRAGVASVLGAYDVRKRSGIVHRSSIEHCARVFGVEADAVRETTRLGRAWLSTTLLIGAAASPAVTPYTEPRPAAAEAENPRSLRQQRAPEEA